MDATRNPADKPSALATLAANRYSFRRCGPAPPTTMATVTATPLTPNADRPTRRAVYEFFLWACSCRVFQRRIRLAAYVTRLERVRESHPSGVQIPYPPPQVPALRSWDHLRFLESGGVEGPNGEVQMVSSPFNSPSS